MLDTADLQTMVAVVKGMKQYQKQNFFKSKDGQAFISQLWGSADTADKQKSVDALCKALGIEMIPGEPAKQVEKGMNLFEVSNYSPTELQVPEDRTQEMHTFPDKRLNSDHVRRAIGAKVIDPQQYWTKQSDLCCAFRASPESIEAALFREVGEGRIAYELTDKEVLFARV